MKRAAFPLMIVVGLAWCDLTARAQALDAETFQDDYQSGDFGRVRYLEDRASVVRASSDSLAGQAESASLNGPLFPGDAIRTDVGGRVEIELAGGGLLRLDRATELTLQALPDPSAETGDNTVLKLSSGTLQIAGRRGDQGEFRVDTPACSVYPLGNGDYRIDVDHEGRTHVASRRGVAEVVGDEGSVLVRGGMRTVVDPRSVPEDPRAFNTFAADGFDRWVTEIDSVPSGEARAGTGADAYEEIPQEVRPYYRELSGYGRWVHLPSYGYAWYPYDRSPGFRPYLDGSWYYGPRGYFWVSTEPWGWAPYHYGRWTWAPGYGWCWIPGRVFGGAWVSWSWGSTCVGWCPLDFWNRPAFHQYRYYGIYDPTCWTFVSYAHIATPGYRRYAVPVDHIGAELRTSVVVRQAPRIAPSALARDPAVRQRALHTALEDRRTRVLPSVSGSATPEQSFIEVEKEVHRPTPRLTSSASVDRRNRDAQPGRGRPLARALRQPSRMDPESVVPSDPGSAVHPPGQDPAARAPSERLRDMYRRMASPRVTREREQAPGARPEPLQLPVRIRRPDTADRGRPSVPAQPRISPPPRPEPPRTPEPRTAQGGKARHGGGEGKKK